MEAVIAKKAHDVEEIITKYLPEKTGYQKTVIEAMHYSVLAGGKRLRPMLMQETYRMCGGRDKVVEPFMAAIEMIHNYSLVHDDLPAMDDDEYRRGRKTTHVVYGEGMAVLCGDALLNYAFETALTAFSQEGADFKKIAEALSVLAEKAGIYGMIGGQTADILAENAENVSAEQLLFIHEHKTAALIEAAVMVGAILAGAEEKAVEQLDRCAYNIGVAFQIQDDILDVVGEEEKLGKAIGSDEKNHKQTYVTLMGLEAAREKVKQLSDEAISILREYPGDSLFLEALTDYLIYRDK